MCLSYCNRNCFGENDGCLIVSDRLYRLLCDACTVADDGQRWVG